MKPLLIKSLAALAVTTVAAVCLVNAVAENPPAASPSPTPETPSTPDTDKTQDGDKPHHGWGHGGFKGKDGMQWGHHDGQFGHFGQFGHGFGHGRHGGGNEIASLGLTDAQRKQIDPILKSQREQIEAIHKQEQSQIQAIISNGKIQILPYLTPQQQAILTDKAKLQADEAALHQSEQQQPPQQAQH